MSPSDRAYWRESWHIGRKMSFQRFSSPFLMALKAFPRLAHLLHLPSVWTCLMCEWGMILELGRVGACKVNISYKLWQSSASLFCFLGQGDISSLPAFLSRPNQPNNILFEFICANHLIFVYEIGMLFLSLWSCTLNKMLRLGIFPSAWYLINQRGSSTHQRVAANNASLYWGHRIFLRR